MLMDIIQEKRLQFIKKFGHPPKRIYLHTDFIKHLKAELGRGPVVVECRKVSKKMPDCIEGMEIFENTEIPGIKVCFAHPHLENQVWY